MGARSHHPPHSRGLIVAPREIPLESILSRRVLDPSGRSAGRIEEVHATVGRDALLVYEYDVGPAALLERLAVGLQTFPLLRKLGIGPEHRGHKVPWNKLDLSDPDHPRITCPREELAPIED